MPAFCVLGTSGTREALPHSEAAWAELNGVGGVVKTVLLANGHFVWVTPAIFVIFRRFPGSKEQNPLSLCAECKIRIFRRFSAKTTLKGRLFSVGVPFVGFGAPRHSLGSPMEGH